MIPSGSTVLPPGLAESHIVGARGNVAIHGNALKAVVEWAACRGLNFVADAVYDDSQIEVPRSTRDRDIERWGPDYLAKSGHAPKTDPECAAIPFKPEATVYYDAEMAGAQHEGIAEMHRESGIVNWEVESYSTPGTKKKFLEDPLKAHAAELPEVIARFIEEALAAFSV